MFILEESEGFRYSKDPSGLAKVRFVMRWEDDDEEDEGTDLGEEEPEDEEDEDEDEEDDEEEK